MQPTTTYSRGDVVLVPFPFSDRTASKFRPALVVNGDRYYQITNDLILAKITGNLNGRHSPGDHHLANWQQAGLLNPSIVKAHLVTLHSSLIKKTIGQMPPNDMQAVEAGLRAALQL